MIIVTMLSTFTMLADMGWSISPACRQLFWIHYVDVGITTCLAAIVLGTAVAAPASSIALAALGFAAWDVCLALGARTQRDTVRWAWFFGALVWLASAFYVLNQYKQQTNRGGRAFAVVHATLSMLLILPCICYSVLWVIADGFRTIPFPSEAIAFTALDFASRVGFAGVFAYKAHVMDASRGFALVDDSAGDR
jgi:bacteriorhodopsin